MPNPGSPRRKPGRRAGISAALASLLALAAAAPAQTLRLTLRADSVHQTIDNFGSSAGFELNEITEAWRESALDTLAELLFSTDTNSNGTLRGIGLSGFRVEIGACSYAQGGASNISRVTARSKCPLLEGGGYDWSQMDAETWWVRKAHGYGLRTIIGYSNSPPVFYTRNGLACRSQTQFVSNLRPDRYGHFAEYLARIAGFYDSIGAPLHFISPVNEPQWEWTCSTQEGTQWSTQEIRTLADSVNAAFLRRQVSTNFLLTEGGQLDYVYLNSFNNNPSTGQLRYWQPGNALYIGDLPKLAPVIAAHGYWTEDTDARLFNIRNNMRNAVRAANPGLSWWQTEFSFLGTGWQALGTNPTRHELGLVLARVIHADLTIGNAAAWQWWETFESTTGHPRYRLVRVDRTAQTAVPEKTYWAIGHYSRFIRPGMRRLHVDRSDTLTIQQTLRDVMPTVFHDPRTGDVTVVLVNFRETAAPVRLQLPGVPDSTRMRPYLSTPALDMAPQPAARLGDTLVMPARSLITLTFGTDLVTTRIGAGKEPARAGGARWSARREGTAILLRAPTAAGAGGAFVRLADPQGRTVAAQRWMPGQTSGRLELRAGVYLLHVESPGTPAWSQRLLVD